MQMLKEHKSLCSPDNTPCMHHIIGRDGAHIQQARVANFNKVVNACTAIAANCKPGFSLEKMQV